MLLMISMRWKTIMSSSRSGDHLCKSEVGSLQRELNRAQFLLSSCRTSCGDPRAQPDPVGESEPKPRGRSVEIINKIPFISVLLNFSFKSVATRNPDLTRLADPSRSPVYSDISIILSKHLVYFIHFKFCKFCGSNSFWQAHKTFTINKRFITFTFNKMPLQKY